MTPAEPSAATGIPSSVVVATHYYATGPAFDLEDYLRERTDRLLFIAHPLYAGGGPSYFRRYQEGRLVETLEAPPPASSARFLSDLIRTVRWVRRFGRVDLYVGGDNLLALAGLWLRSTRRVRSVVLYSIDYVPRRFANPVLNRLYHRVDRLVARRANVVWNLSPAIEAARRSRDGAGNAAPQLVVPVGNHFGQIQRSVTPSNPAQIAFLGHLLRKQGLQLAIEAMAAIRERVPAVSLLVLGDGPFLPELRQLAARVGADDVIEFAGYVEDHREIERRLAAAALGIAPYVPDKDSFTRFADPGKIKTYLGCGLPVVLTDVPPGARLIEERGAGRIVAYEAPALARAVIDYLTDPAALERARRAAAALGAEFDWERVFAEGFRASAPYLR